MSRHNARRREETPRRGLTRRALLGRGLLGGVLLAVGGGTWVAFQPSKLVALPAEPLQVLDERTYSILWAVVDRLLPGPVASEAAKKAVPARIDALLAAADGRTRNEFTKLLGLFENGLTGLLFERDARPFTQRAPAAQDAALEGWRTSRVALRRTGYQALKRIAMATYYADPTAYADAGYPGPPTLPRTEVQP